MNKEMIKRSIAIALLILLTSMLICVSFSMPHTCTEHFCLQCELARYCSYELFILFILFSVFIPFLCIWAFIRVRPVKLFYKDISLVALKVKLSD